MLAQGADSNASDKTQASVLSYTVAVKGNMPVVMLLRQRRKRERKS